MNLSTIYFLFIAILVIEKIIIIFLSFYLYAKLFLFVIIIINLPVVWYGDILDPSNVWLSFNSCIVSGASGVSVPPVTIVFKNGN